MGQIGPLEQMVDWIVAAGGGGDLATRYCQKGTALLAGAVFFGNRRHKSSSSQGDAPGVRGGCWSLSHVHQAHV
jgi:hypothetical protein